MSILTSIVYMCEQGCCIREGKDWWLHKTPPLWRNAWRMWAKNVCFSSSILAITLVWKVQIQQFEHFSVANNELFHMVCSTHQLFSTQNSWIMDTNPWYECENDQIWVEKHFGVKCTMWKSSLKATEKCSNCWNRTFQTETMYEVGKHTMN